MRARASRGGTNAILKDFESKISRDVYSLGHIALGSVSIDSIMALSH